MTQLKSKFESSYASSFCEAKLRNLSMKGKGILRENR